MDEYPQQKSWFGRNWLWVVPLGCLSPIIAVVGCGVLFFVGIEGSLKNSEVYRLSKEAVLNDDHVRAELGEPITPSMFVSGNINVSTNGGHTDITYSLTGPKSSGTVHAVGDKQNGGWVIKKNHVVIAATNKEFDVPVQPQAR